jgi:hypothetical protein
MASTPSNISRTQGPPARSSIPAVSRSASIQSTSTPVTGKASVPNHPVDAFQNVSQRLKEAKKATTKQHRKRAANLPKQAPGRKLLLNGNKLAWFTGKVDTFLKITASQASGFYDRIMAEYYQCYGICEWADDCLVLSEPPIPLPSDASDRDVQELALWHKDTCKVSLYPDLTPSSCSYM